jgi:RNA polymerase sigma-70 factor (ECF subfamily)
MLAEADQADAAEPPPEIPDERLRLIFTCCHPALDPKSRVALTLRTLGGLTTEEIARAFLDQPATMGQRLSRAKAKIAGAGIPFAVPDAQDWAARLDSVLAVIYLIFNEGYAATQGEGQLRVDMCEEAVFLARMLSGLLPAEAEPLGLLALILTTHARRPARVGTGVGGRDGGGGALIPLDAQDRGLWDRQLIGEGLAALDRAMALRQPGPCQIKAAISALHVQADSYPATDWPQMLLLYDSLLAHEPSDVVRLNRAVALAEVAGARAALAALAPLADTLADYQPFHAARAHLLAADGQRDAARAAYDRAIALSGTAAERRFLEIRRAALG